MNVNGNMFNILRDLDEYEIEDNEYIHHYYPIENVKKEKFTDKEVDMLYNYFVQKGLSNKKQLRCLPQNWRISEEHIYASLRRNNGDIHKAGQDLSELIQNTNFDIRTFYAKFPYSELLASQNNVVYFKPYLSGQEWQIKPEKGVYLINNNRVYKINHVSLEYGCFKLDMVITKDYNIKTVNFTDDDVRYGKYKQIKEENLQEYLEKEYKFLGDELEKVSKDGEVWLSKQFKKREKYVKSITKLEKYHENNCTLNAKLKIVGRFDLPIFIIKKIVSYDIESLCDHYWQIQDLKNGIDYTDYIIDEGYMPYNNLKWKKEIAYHVLRGDYEEWLLEDFY